MFSGATAFNQDLCHYGGNWPYANAIRMFEYSGCQNTLGPNSADGPWCAKSSCRHKFTTTPELKTAIKEYLGQGCASDLNCQARSDYGGAVSPSWCSPLVYRICISYKPFFCNSDWGLGRVSSGEFRFIVYSR